MVLLKNNTLALLSLPKQKKNILINIADQRL